MGNEDGEDMGKKGLCKSVLSTLSEDNWPCNLLSL